MILEVSKEHHCKLDKISRNCYFEHNLGFSVVFECCASISTVPFFLQNGCSFLLSHYVYCIESRVKRAKAPPPPHLKNVLHTALMYPNFIKNRFFKALKGPLRSFLELREKKLNCPSLVHQKFRAFVLYSTFFAVHPTE